MKKLLLIFCLLLFSCEGEQGPTGPQGDKGNPGTQGPSGSGDITEVLAGSGLTGGGTSGSVTLSIGSGFITTDMIVDKALTLSKINSSGASVGQVIMYNGSNVIWNTVESNGGNGEGDITSVTAGTGLTGGGNSGSVVLSLNTGFADSRYVKINQSNSITSYMIKDGEIKSGDIASGQVVKSINGQKDAVTISFDGITIPHKKDYNSGNILFEITQNGSAPIMRLHMNGSTSSEAFGVYNNGGGGEAGSFIVDNSNNDADALYVFHKGKGKAGFFRISNPNEYSAKFTGGRGISVDGEVYKTSDIRFKKNISTINNALNNVLRLRGVNFEWNRDKYPDIGFSEGNNIGFIAQEVEPFFPEAISTDKDGYKSVAYSSIIPVLVEAIKEQQKIIEKQQNDINSLIQRVNTLEHNELKLSSK